MQLKVEWNMKDFTGGDKRRYLKPYWNFVDFIFLVTNEEHFKMKYVKKKHKKIDLKIYPVFTSGTNKSASTYERVTLAKMFPLNLDRCQTTENLPVFQKVY